jgi:hypothetical protein
VQEKIEPDSKGSSSLPHPKKENQLGIVAETIVGGLMEFLCSVLVVLFWE